MEPAFGPPVLEELTTFFFRDGQGRAVVAFQVVEAARRRVTYPERLGIVAFRHCLVFDSQGTLFHGQRIHRVALEEGQMLSDAGGFLCNLHAARAGADDADPFAIE